MAATDAAFITLAGRGEAELRVRGSRFLAVAAPAATEEAARELLTSLQRLHFDATHHCSAWRFREGSWRANDAGEPGGSAGAPILAAIDADGLIDTAVIVIRYFGGTKLGVGGLVRAYGDAAAAALAVASRREGMPAVHVRIPYEYSHTAPVMRVLDSAGAAEVRHGFASGGAAAVVEATVPLGDLQPLRETLRETTAGAVQVETTGTSVLYRRLPRSGSLSA